MKEPLITVEKLDSATLDHWQEEFWFVYARQDRERDLHQVWSMAYEDATRVGEAIREHNPLECLTALAHTFCWIASFVAKLGKDQSVHPRFKMSQFDRLSSVVWFKYPDVCPTCFRGSCICPLIKRSDKPSEEEQRRELEESREKPAPNFSMNAWGEMFKRIYDNAHFIKSLDELGFHLLEEMGEVQEIIRKIAIWGGKKWRDKPREKEEDLAKLQLKLVEEVADTVSWCFSIVRKIAADAEKYQELEKSYRPRTSAKQGSLITPTLTLSKVLWKVYRRKRRNEIGCPIPTCRQRHCKCEIGHWQLIG